MSRYGRTGVAGNIGRCVMEILDRFFDGYERLTPRHFGEFMVAPALASLAAWILA